VKSEEFATAPEKHGLSFFTTWSDESNRARHEKKRQKKSVFLPTKHRFLGIFICHGQHGLTVLCA